MESEKLEMEKRMEQGHVFCTQTNPLRVYSQKERVIQQQKLLGKSGLQGRIIDSKREQIIQNDLTNPKYRAII